MPEQVVDLKKNQKPSDANVPTSSQSISWDAQEFAFEKKSAQWYATLFGVAGILILLTVLTGDYTATALFLVAAAVVALYAKKEPRTLRFALSPKGVQVENRLYPYEDLRSFWIFYDPPKRAELSIRSNKKLMPYIRLPLGKVNPAEVHRYLSRFIPELKHADSVVDALSRRVGF